MCLLLREALTVGKIAFHDHFLSVELNGPEAKKALVDEMMNVCNTIRTQTANDNSRFVLRSTAWSRRPRRRLSERC